MSPAIVGLLAVIQLAGQERAVVKFSIGSSDHLHLWLRDRKAVFPALTVWGSDQIPTCVTHF